MRKATKWACALVTGLLAVGLMSSSATASASAKLDAGKGAVAFAATPGFEIYYSPNCTNASRQYLGQNFGEWWINDTFNRTTSGSAGYGQKIRNNAASVRLYSASLWIASASDMQTGKASFYKSAAYGCFNLEPSGLRNNNVWWATGYHVP